MIEVHSNGKAVYLAAVAIAQVTEAGVSSQWHGIRSYIKTFDGRTVECEETASQIVTAMKRGEA